MITLVLLAGWLAWELARGQRPVAIAVVYGIVTAGAFEIYSFGGLPWVGLMGLAAVALLLIRSRDLRATVTIGAIAVVAFLVAALPQIPDSLDFYDQGNRLLGKQHRRRRRKPDRPDPDLGGIRGLAGGRLPAAAERSRVDLRAGRRGRRAGPVRHDLVVAAPRDAAADDRGGGAAGMAHHPRGALHRGEVPHDPLARDRAARAGRRLGARVEWPGAGGGGAGAGGDGRHLHIRRPGLPRRVPRAEQAARGAQHDQRPVLRTRARDARRVRGVRQALSARRPAGRAVRRVDAGRAVAARAGASRVRALLRPRRDDAAVRGAVSASDPTALAGREPPTGELPIGVRGALLPGLASHRGAECRRAPGAWRRHRCRGDGSLRAGDPARGDGSCRLAPRGRRAPGADRIAGAPDDPVSAWLDGDGGQAAPRAGGRGADGQRLHLSRRRQLHDLVPRQLRARREGAAGRQKRGPRALGPDARADGAGWEREPDGRAAPARDRARRRKPEAWQRAGRGLRHRVRRPGRPGPALVGAAVSRPLARAGAISTGSRSQPEPDKRKAAALRFPPASRRARTSPPSPSTSGSCSGRARAPSTPWTR